MVPMKLTANLRIAVLAGVAVSCSLVGCAEAAKSTGGKQPTAAQPARAGKSGGLKLPGLSGGNYATVFAIQCMETQGPEGVKMVEIMAKGLRNVQSLDGSLVQTQTKGRISRLYYGAYKGAVKKELDQFVPPDKAKDDLATIRSITNGQMQPFQLATIAEMPTPDPGPAEWNLKTAPGIYSLQITYCFDKPGLPNHKEVAVAICKALREQGEEAWYLHADDRVSVVTVGHFDDSAVEKGPDGQALRYGPTVIALQNKREEFKYNTECLRKVYRVTGDQRIAAASALIKIPRESTNEQPARSAEPNQQQPLQRRNPPRYW